jgi:hypothetical protein
LSKEGKLLNKEKKIDQQKKMDHGEKKKKICYQRNRSNNKREIDHRRTKGKLIIKE